MPHINGNITNGQIIIPIYILKANYIKECIAKSVPLDLPNKSWRGLIDTGAQRSCVASHVAESLSLQAHGQQTMQSASGPYDANLYTIDFHIPASQSQSINGHSWPFAECSNSNFEILIGMDLILKGGLQISSNSSFTLFVL